MAEVITKVYRKWDGPEYVGAARGDIVEVGVGAEGLEIDLEGVDSSDLEYETSSNASTPSEPYTDLTPHGIIDQIPILPPTPIHTTFSQTTPVSVIPRQYHRRPPPAQITITKIPLPGINFVCLTTPDLDPPRRFDTDTSLPLYLATSEPYHTWRRSDLDRRRLSAPGPVIPRLIRRVSRLVQSMDLGGIVSVESVMKCSLGDGHDNVLDVGLDKPCVSRPKRRSLSMGSTPPLNINKNGSGVKRDLDQKHQQLISTRGLPRAPISTASSPATAWPSRSRSITRSVSPVSADSVYSLEERSDGYCRDEVPSGPSSPTTSSDHQLTSPWSPSSPVLDTSFAFTCDSHDTTPDTIEKGTAVDLSPTSPSGILPSIPSDNKAETLPSFVSQPLPPLPLPLRSSYTSRPPPHTLFTRPESPLLPGAPSQRDSEDRTSSGSSSSPSTTPLASKYAPPTPRSSTTTPSPHNPVVSSSGTMSSINTNSWYDDQDQHVIDPHPPIPSLLNYTYISNRSIPSVPSSNRTSSSTVLTPRDPSLASPPSTYVQFSNSIPRRPSKYTLSSSSSIRSSDSFNRGPTQHWHFGEQPDISTVFEEEPVIHLSVDGEEVARENRNGAQQFKSITKDSEPRAYIPPPGTRYPNISASSRVPNIPTRAYRSPTISSQPSYTSARSTKSTKTVHPFAAAAAIYTTRSASPPPLPPLPSSSTDYLLPHPHPFSNQALSSSESQPNLRMSTSGGLQPAHQVSLVVQSDKKDDEENCPICVESLSYDYRLPGEKPHVVPECGHALHEECFTQVYGKVPAEGPKRVLGVCGVCRQPIRVLDGGGGKKKGGDKLAALTGQQKKATPGHPDSLKNPPYTRSTSGQKVPASLNLPRDPHMDDPLEIPASVGMSASSSSRSQNEQVIVPAISIRNEYPSMVRGMKDAKPTTAMVIIDVPQAGNRGRYPAKIRPQNMSRGSLGDNALSPPLPPSPRSTISGFERSNSARQAATPDSFAHVIADLRARVVDYKNSALDELGPLRLFDLLSVRKNQLRREFHVYLFTDALICISEEKKTGIRSMFSTKDKAKSSDGKGVLKLKGRIFMKHVKEIEDTSVPGELSLTITMEDEKLEAFILTFKDRGSHETWKNNLNRLIEEGQSDEDNRFGGSRAGSVPNSATLGNSSKISRMMGQGAPLPATTQPRSAGVGMSSALSFGDLATPSSGFSNPNSSYPPISPVPGEGRTLGDLAYNQPLAPIHAPLDLFVILSLPVAPLGRPDPTLQLRSKLMRQSLAFVLALLGPRDRISLVACEIGAGGVLRKTPLLNTTNYESRLQLETFVESLGVVRTLRDEVDGESEEMRHDVIGAVNVGLDIVLQRKSKNPLSGMIVISDTSENIKRTQMDMVTARLDAANIPVHTVGYGKGHDPSPLWMLANHTHGSYTFVREWYDLRDTLAGLVGGLCSIALTNFKLHMTCGENEFKVLKVSGSGVAIVSMNGKDVDVELKELRFGETREVIVELRHTEGDEEDAEVEEKEEASGSDFSGAKVEGSKAGSVMGGQPSIRKTPSFSKRSIIDTLSVKDADALRYEVYEETLVDDVPVTEVDCSFHDPAVNRSVSRLAHPVLLTVTMLPRNSTRNPPSTADHGVVRRKMELLVSDMMTRALLIASRKNWSQAVNLILTTKQIQEVTIKNWRGGLDAIGGSGQSKREVMLSGALDRLCASLADLEDVLEGMQYHRNEFIRDYQNSASQQAHVLRNQKSWTVRTGTERLYCTNEVQYLIRLSNDWITDRN